MNRFIGSVIICALSVIGNASSASLWKEIKLPPAAQGFAFIDFADSLDGVIFSPYGIYAKTADGGKSWDLDSVSIVGKITQIRYLGRGHCWMRADGNTSVLYSSADCKTWVPRTLPDTLTFYSTGFATMEKIFLAGRKGIVSTENGGSTWKNIYPIKNASYGCTSFADSVMGMASFWGFSTSGETNGRALLRTVNGGITWDTVAVGPTQYYPIKFYTAKKGYVVWSNAGLEGMPRFAGVNLIGDSAKIVSSMLTWGSGSDWLDPLAVVQYGSAPPFIVATSSRLKDVGGDRFSITRADPAALTIVAYETVSPTANWILTETNRLFQSVGVPTHVHSETEFASPTEFSLSQNFPNPFNPSTTISFNIPTRSFVSLKVFDVMGREAATIASEEMPAGNYSMQWNASGRPSGVYFYRLQTGAYTKTKRLIYLK